MMDMQWYAYVYVISLDINEAVLSIHYRRLLGYYE